MLGRVGTELPGNKRKEIVPRVPEREGRGIVRNPADCAAGLLGPDPRRAIRADFKVVDEVVRELRRETPDEAGFDVLAVRARIVDVAGALERDVVHRLERFLYDRAGLADRRDEFLGPRRISTPDDADRGDRLRHAGAGAEVYAGVHLVRQGLGILAEELEHLLGFGKREREFALDDLALHRM